MAGYSEGKKKKEVGGKFRLCLSLGHSNTSTLLPEELSKSIHHTPELLEAGIFTAAVPKCLDPGVKPLNSLAGTTMDKGVNKHVHITVYYHFKGDMWIRVCSTGREGKTVVGSGDGQGFRLPCSHVGRTALCTKPNAFQGNLAQHCYETQTARRQLPNLFSLIPLIPH